MERSLALPTEISGGLEEFLQAAKNAFGQDLVSAVLFGSAAEGRLRTTSDINLLLILSRFDRKAVDALRDPLRTAHAAIRLEVMFLLQGEIEKAMDAFAVKFSDILGRRKVLYGPDLLAKLTVSRKATLNRTQQVLLNLQLRMRTGYALVSLREEQLALTIANLAGPLRACAAAILQLEGQHPASPKEAFNTILSETNGANASGIPALIDTARREGSLPAGAAGSLLFSLMEIADAMYRRTAVLAEQLQEGGR
jgi:predicted nucleotidyltransferase